MVHCKCHLWSTQHLLKAFPRARSGFPPARICSGGAPYCAQLQSCSSAPLPVPVTTTILWENLQKAGRTHCFTCMVINNSSSAQAAASSSWLNVKLDLLSPLPSVHNSSHLPKLCEKWFFMLFACFRASIIIICADSFILQLWQSLKNASPINQHIVGFQNEIFSRWHLLLLLLLLLVSSLQQQSMASFCFSFNCRMSVDFKTLHLNEVFLTRFRLFLKHCIRMKCFWPTSDYLTELFCHKSCLFSSQILTWELFL